MAEKKNVAPIGYFQLLGSGKSGWFLEGTQNTTAPVELMFPEARNVMNRGKVKKAKKDADAEGNEYENYDLVETRYIKNCPTFDLNKQVEKNYKPHEGIHAKEDWITFKNGELTVPREGALTVLYDYLMTGTSQNIDNPFRIEGAAEVFRVIKMNLEAEASLDIEELQDDARAKVKQWREKVGGTWQYNTEKIDLACEVIGLPAQGLEDAVKLKTLMRYATDRPEDFLRKVVKMEQTTITEIHQAIQLRAIEFVGNMAMYVEVTTGKKDSIYSVGQGKLTPETKVDKLASWFRTEDGKGAYEIFKAVLNDVKEKSLTEK